MHNFCVVLVKIMIETYKIWKFNFRMKLFIVWKYFMQYGWLLRWPNLKNNAHCHHRLVYSQPLPPVIILNMTKGKLWSGYRNWHLLWKKPTKGMWMGSIYTTDRARHNSVLALSKREFFDKHITPLDPKPQYLLQLAVSENHHRSKNISGRTAVCLE